MLNYLRAQTITETKGVLKDVTATIDGFDFIFGTGGIHGSVSNQCVESDDEFVIESRDVASYYPNLAIANRFYPAHLGETFCDIYAELYEQRKQYPKESTESKMLKLALNGTFGDSGNRFSVFYDPLFLLQITLNGQLLLCMLVDGLEYRVARQYTHQIEVICKQWEQQTGLTLEKAIYSRMWIRDCNNYLAEYAE